LRFHFPLYVGESVQQQLTNVSLSDGVTAIDAFVDELLEEIAEEEIDGVREKAKGPSLLK
jgi:hypothetical protein